MSLLEGILSRGGEEIGDLIETAFRLGCRFDGWSDRLRYDLWEEAFRRTGIDPVASLRERPPTECFPWERIETGVSREFLLSETLRAERCEPTPDCRTGECSRCGVCDHRVVRIITTPADSPVGTLTSIHAGGGDAPGVEKTYRLRFTKLGPARFLSHIELAAALGRAIILSGIAFVYSQGFHPHPKISFAGATAVGVESEGEFADIRIQDPGEKPETRIARINAGLPAGVAVTAMHELPTHAFSLAEMITGFEYDLILPDDFDRAELERIEDAIRAFREAESFGVTRESKGKPVIKDIRPFVAALTLDHTSHRIRLSARFGPAGTVRPAELLSSALGITPDALHRIRIVKTGARLADFAGDDDREIFFPVVL